MKINKRFLIEIISTVLLLVFFIILIILNYTDIRRKNATKTLLDDATKISNNATFMVNLISCYSSASPANIDDSKGTWKFDLYQYTDIAIYVSNLSSNIQSITKFYLDDFKYEGLESGTPNICYKNLNSFGNFEDDKIQNQKIDFEIISTDTDLNFSKPQIYADLSNPICLEYKNQIFTDKELTNLKTISYDGSILKNSSILLSTISCKVSFKIHIITDDNVEHTSNISFDIPLSSETTSIYSGSFTKDIKYSVRF